MSVIQSDAMTDAELRACEGCVARLLAGPGYVHASAQVMPTCITVTMLSGMEGVREAAARESKFLIVIESDRFHVSPAPARARGRGCCRTMAVGALGCASVAVGFFWIDAIWNML